MALQAVLATLEGIPEEIQKEYKEADDGSFYLDVTSFDSHPQVGALSRARDHEKEKRKTVQSELNQAREELSTARQDLEKARSQGSNTDHKERADDWERKYNKDTEKLKAQVKEAENRVQKVVHEDKALSLASEWFVSPTLTKNAVKERIKPEVMENGEVAYRVLDKEGRVTASSLDDLKQEFAENPEFSAVLKAGKGSGSASSKGDEDKRPPSGGQENKTPDLNTESDAEAAARRKAAREAAQ